MEQSTRPLLILGTRTFAAEVADLVSEIPGVLLDGYVENMDRERCRETLGGVPVLWVDDLKGFAETHWAVCALATTHRSRFTEQVGAHGIRFATLVHPSARVSSSSSLGEGTIVSVGVIIAAHTHLGRHVIVNRGALVGHHTQIGSHVTIGPGANIAGSCRIGENTYIGIGAIVTDNIRIGAHSFVSAGALVAKDVPDNVQVAGAPARIIKSNFPGR